MIQIESVQVAELRGIRELLLNMEKRNFVVWGPNGSGKSGVVDAIEFGLTGDISRLSGKGTAGITVASHGPHVDMVNYPDATFVRLEFYIPKLEKSATVTRKVSQPKKVQVEPDEADVHEVLASVAAHPEITLSRRDIIKFILIEPSKRSEEVHALLKLDDVTRARAKLKTCENKLGQAQTTSKARVSEAEDALRRHLDVQDLSVESILEVVNKRRQVLSLPLLEAMDAETVLNEGVSGGGNAVAQNIESALRDVGALKERCQQISTLCADNVSAVIQGLERLEQDPGLLAALSRRVLVETGLELIDEPLCPLCDTEWEVEELREHLVTKLAKSRDADELQQDLLKNGRALAEEAGQVAKLARGVAAVAQSESEVGFAGRLMSWANDLSSLAERLGAIEGLVASKARLEDTWIAAPASVSKETNALREKLCAKPDQSAAVAAQTFLALAQDRLDAWRRARRLEESTRSALDAGKAAYKAYTETSDGVLESLYAEVEADLSRYYQELNRDDEAAFVAKLEPEEGKLGLKVDFYSRGMFPPGAYHSEGHQDGMGVCLYLALMKRVLGADFRLAVLDDVVMSVDAQHRKQFCKLLKTEFPETQFVITTHDQVWARQMRAEGLVTAKSTVAFQSWSVETGPISEAMGEAWDEIDEALTKTDVPRAAARLRRHLEFVAHELADCLGAKPSFRGDGSYDMGDLMSAVIGRHGELLGLAAKAAQSWGNEGAIEAIRELKAARGVILDEHGGEAWVVNKALHYNDWANFQKEDFEPVVACFKAVLSQFRCAKCGSWYHVTPRKNPEDLRCDCGSFRLNLKSK